MFGLSLLLTISLAIGQLAFCGSVIKIELKGQTTPGAGPHGVPRSNFFTDLRLGIPAQTFKVQFDTNHRYLWVPLKKIETLDENKHLHYSNGFNCGQSKTCQELSGQNKVEFVHANSTMESNLMQDQMDLPGIKPLFTRLQFGAVSSATSDYSMLPIDGIFGLSPSEESFPGYSSSLLSLQFAGIVEELQFGLWFNQTGSGGEITLGGQNWDRVSGPKIWLQSISSTSWKFVISSVTYGSHELRCLNKNCKLFIGTGLSETYGHPEDVQRLYDLLGVKLKDNIPTVNCSRAQSSPPLGFNIYNKLFEFPASNFIKPLDESTCYVSIFKHPVSYIWVFGTDLLSAYYSSFDVSTKKMALSDLKE